VARVLPGRDAADGQFRQHADVDQARIIAFNQGDVGIEIVQPIAVELLQGIDILDLLHRQHVRAHGADAVGDLLRGGGVLGLHQPAEVGAQTDAARRELVFHRPTHVRPAGRQGIDLRLEVIAREKIVEIERADRDFHANLLVLPIRGIG